MLTDTVYGLVSSALIADAVSKMYRAKGRDKKPGTLIAANTDQLLRLGIDAKYIDFVESKWPGPTSIVLPAPEDLDYLNFGLGSLAVRVPSDKKLKSLLIEVGPLATTSANKPGHAVANNIVEAKNYFQDLVDFYQDDGDASGRRSSEVLLLKKDGTLKKLR